MQVHCVFMRVSKYRKEILDLFKKRHLLTIAEINKLVPEADYSTVFRNIEKLLVDKKIKKVVIDNKLVAYESSDDVHDHFICDKCGDIESMHLSIRNNIKDKTVTDIVIRGMCNNCIK